MARRTPDQRIAHLVETATTTFIAQGYQRTQMEEIANSLGVAKGTLYGYVESKAALLDATLRFADGLEPLPNADELPLPTPGPGKTIDRVRARLAAETQGLQLAVAVNCKRVVDPSNELTTIIHDLFGRLSRNRRGIKLLDRLSSEIPEFSALWFGEGRWAQHMLLMKYLDRRLAMGAICPLPNPPIVARAILETITFWAVHRHWDPSPQQVADADVESTVTTLILRWLIKETS